MEEIKEEGPVVECGPNDPCPHCLKREEEQKEMDELGLAVLIALVPALTITLFSNLGLF
jgi:hypothetical protein